MKTMKKAMLTGLAALVLATGAAGCTPDEQRAGGEYSRTLKMPQECISGEVLSAGYSGSIAGKHSVNNVSNYDWISCKDTEGNIWVYRVNKQDTIIQHYTKFER